MDLHAMLTAALKHAADGQNTAVEELKDYLRLPSVSTQPAHDADVAATAEWTATALRQAGLENVAVIATAHHPLVYADWLHAGPQRPTVLIYGHYDVQPAEPLALWETPPFEPTVRDDFIYARGASDDKGQTYVHIKAVAAYLQTSGALPVNVKFIIEGEEESGGQSLTAFIPANKEMLAADVAVVSDTAIVSADLPAIVYGLRGNTYVLLDITGPERDLHSGSFGGAINNPLNVLGHVIAALKDPDGTVRIPGFYDDVRLLSAEERTLLNALPLTEADLLAETGAPAVWGEPDYTIVERLSARPTLDVHGIIGGYTGPGAKTVLPSTVHAKISMRLVPDQDPARIAAAFKAYVESLVPESCRVTFEIRGGGGAPATVVDYRVPAIQAARRAYAEAFGREPILKREGGSIPVVGQFQTFLGLETVLMGFGLPGDRLHAPNERFYLPNFRRGIETSIRFLTAYAELAC